MLKIKIYPDNKHQVLTIPIKVKVADVFLDKLDMITKEKYGKNIEDFIKKVSLYRLLVTCKCCRYICDI